MEKHKAGQEGKGYKCGGQDHKIQIEWSGQVSLRRWAHSEGGVDVGHAEIWGSNLEKAGKQSLWSCFLGSRKSKEASAAGQGEVEQGWDQGRAGRGEEKALPCHVGPKQLGLTLNEKAAGESFRADKVHDVTCM